MRVCKWIPVLLLAVVISSCSSGRTEESTPATPDSVSTNPAPSEPTTPAPAPADPVPAPAPAPKPAPVKPPKASSRSASSAPAPSAAPAPPPPAIVENREPARPAVKDEPPAPVVKKPEPIVIPAGTELNVSLADALNSGKNKAGDEFTANLTAPVYANGTTVLERGARVEGKVVAAEGSGRVSGKANMTITLTGVMHNDKIVPIVTKDLVAEAESSTGRDVKTVGGGAGIGAIIGAITGGKKGAATGAAIGGAAGTGAVLVTKGKQVDYPSESKLSFNLEKDITLTR
jgi:hypothetical protein